MVQQIAVTRSDTRIGQVLMDLQRFCFHPLSVLPIETFLRNLADIDLRVEVRGESLMMITGIAVNNVQILYLIKMMLGSVGRKDARHTRIEATAQDGSQTGLLETLPISPLP